jgi:hypothetical protein
MPRPGVDVQITEPAPTGGAITDTGQGFFVQAAEMGPTDKATMLRSLREYERRYGLRHGPAIVTHDSVRAFFTERGSTLWFARAVGQGAAPAEADLLGSDGTTVLLHATAISGGAWGNDVTVGLEAQPARAGRGNGGGTGGGRRRQHGEEGEGGARPEQQAGEPVRVVVTHGDVVEHSTVVTTAGEAVAWSVNSQWITLTADNPGVPLEAVAPVALAGGASDDTLTPDTVAAALDLFSTNYGPGQVSVPGATDPTIHDAVLAHCAKTKRCALIDLVDGDATTLETDVQGLYGVDGSRFAQAYAPRLLYPGPDGISTIPVPYSAIQAGIIARADRTTGNPNEAAAGTNGMSQAARGLSREYTDDEREMLNDAGVTLAKVIYTSIRTYGARTCAGPDDPNWKWFANSRVIMAISYEGDAIAENYVHKQIDAKLKIFDTLNQDLGGMCLKYMTLNALWDFSVDTGPAVNTPDTIAAGEIHALIAVKTAPTAEWVVLEISKNPIV